MALIKADRVKESSTSTGASTFALAGAFTGFRAFSSVCSVGDTFYYVIDSDLGSEWEAGLGTYSAANTLTRTTVHSSSNGGSIVTFSAGTKNVYISLTGNQLGTLATLAGSEVLTNKTINASNNTVTNVSLTTGVTGTLPLANGGTGTTTAQLAINALAGAVTSGSYLRGNGTNVVMAAIQAADVPTLNQNTTGTASGSVSGTASYLAKFTSTNVVGNSQIVDNATGVGIGVAPTVAKFEVSAPENTDAFALAQWKLLKWDTTSQITFGGYTAGQWQVLKFFTAGAERFRIDASGNVGIGTSTSLNGIFTPLHVNAVSSYGSILSSQATATVVADSGGELQFAATYRTTFGGGDLTQVARIRGLRENATVNNWAGYLAFYTSTGSDSPSASTERMRINSSGNVGIGTSAPADRLHVYKSGDASAKVEGTTSAVVNFTKNAVYCGYVGVGSAGSNDIYIYNLASGAVRINNQAVYVTAANLVGINNQTPGAQLHVTSAAAATKGMIVRGASAQSANLQEWQNSSGTALAYVNSAGDIWGAGGGIFTGTGNGTDGYGESGPVVGVNKWLSYAPTSIYNNIRKLYGTRAFPATYANGDYVEIAKIARQHFQPITLTIHAAHGAVNGAASKVYVITPDYNFGNWTAAPLSGGKVGDFDFDVELVAPDPYWLAVRVRRHSSSTPTYANIMFTIECHNYNRGGMVELSGTGNSASALPYRSDYQRIGPTVSAPPPAGGSGAGTSLSISAANAVTTGAGGGITLQAGNAATTGSGGSITLYTGAGAGTGVGGLIQSRSQADSYNRSSKFILVRSIPDTVGNYVELGRIGWLAGTVQKVSVFASRGAYDATNQTYNALGKEYEFSAHYYTSGTVAPRTISGNTGGGRQPNEFELEMAWNANGYQVLRLRRSKADATNFGGYTATVVIEQSIWSPHAMEFVELSGTGTSAFTNGYLTNTGTYCYPALIPPPTSGTSGAGTDLAIYGGSAIGTGAGGSVILQPGAQATSGGDGTVISRRGANGVSNIHHFQASTNTYAFFDYSGRLCITPEVSTTVMPVDCGLFVTPRNNANTIGVVVRGVSGQAGNLQQWQNNAGTVLSAVNSAGSFTNTGGYSYSEEFGNAATVTNQYATAIGYGTTAGQLSTAVGSFAVTSGVTSTAIGADANADGGSTAVGRQATASGGSATAIGVNANAVGNNSIAIGRLAASNGGIAIGYNFTGAGLGYTSFCASLNGTSTTGAIAVYAGDGANNGNFSRQHSILGTWATATYASRLGRVQLRVNDFTTDREAIRYESDGASALTSIGGAAVIASTTLAVQPAVSGNKGIVVKGASAQTANLTEWQNSAGSVLSAVKSDGSIQPASLADSAATNNSIYYSTTASKLVYKDAAGTVNNLY